MAKNFYYNNSSSDNCNRRKNGAENFSSDQKSLESDGIYESIEMLQDDLDEWLQEYNESRPHCGKYCCGKTPMQTFLDSLPLAKEKMVLYSNNISNQKEI